MKFIDLSVNQLRRHLIGGGISFQIGPFVVYLHSDLPDLAVQLHRLYADYPIFTEKSFADFHITLERSGGWRRWWRAQVRFRLDDETPFHPFPQDTALPFLEWGLNWSIATRAHQYLMLHSGVVEKNGRAVLLPGWPGSGKSTLCAALACRGWRLLSDEFALIRPHDLLIMPLPRLVALKNESIQIMRTFAPDAVFGPEFPKTRKGTVSHMRPPYESVARVRELARANWIVFPHFQSGAGVQLELFQNKARSFIKLAGNSFNYELIGLRGFETVDKLIESCSVYSLQYGDLKQAIKKLDELVA